MNLGHKRLPTIPMIPTIWVVPRVPGQSIRATWRKRINSVADALLPEKFGNSPSLPQHISDFISALLLHLLLLLKNLIFILLCFHHVIWSLNRGYHTLQSNNLPTLGCGNIWSEWCTSPAQRAWRYLIWFKLLFKLSSKCFSHSIVDIQFRCKQHSWSIESHAPLVSQNFRRTRKRNSKVSGSREVSCILIKWL